VTRLPFSRAAVWYPTLGLLALEEIVELPIVTAVVIGRRVAERRSRHPGTRQGPVAGPVVGH
jgi:hypothetical protein